jgi:four helix bundle protein
MKSYQELDVWQKGVSLSIEVYKVTEEFPRSEKFGLTAQTRRAAVSIPANIAEGWGRGSTREYVQFLLVARGSIFELETHLIIGQKLGFLEESRLGRLLEVTQAIGRMVNGLILALRARCQGAASRPPRAPAQTPSP